MDIEPNIEMIDLALYLREHNTLILSDFHLGYEEMLTSRGTLIPRFQFKDTIDRLEKIFEKVELPVDRIIINGDLKHEFGTISNQEWREVLNLLDFFWTKCKKVIIVKGNHDTFLGPIANKRNASIVKNVILDNILIAHGDCIEDETKNREINTIIIGHEHPAITLRDNQRVERCKCFLKGQWLNKTLIVQPSFNLVTEGTDVTKEKTLSPYLDKSLKNFELWVIAEKVLYFGKLKNVQ